MPNKDGAYGRAVHTCQCQGVVATTSSVYKHLVLEALDGLWGIHSFYIPVPQLALLITP